MDGQHQQAGRGEEINRRNLFYGQDLPVHCFREFLEYFPELKFNFGSGFFISPLKGKKINGQEMTNRLHHPSFFNGQPSTQ
jgi:hypothetical protein